MQVNIRLSENICSPSAQHVPSHRAGAQPLHRGHLVLLHWQAQGRSSAFTEWAITSVAGHHGDLLRDKTLLQEVASLRML